jgi:hypothetical protein
VPLAAPAGARAPVLGPDGARADGTRRGDLAQLLAVNSSVSADLVPVLYQLLSGAVDATACRRLNMSPRTFSRRVADVLDELGVSTRFQGGAECGRRAVLALAWRRNQERLQAAAGTAASPPARLPVPPGWHQSPASSARPGTPWLRAM